MTRIRIATGVTAALCLAAFGAFAANEAAPRPATKDGQPTAQSRSSLLSWGRHEQDAAPRSSRLKFRSADGTCACSCARGGITEEEIRKAQQARERAQS